MRIIVKDYPKCYNTLNKWLDNISPKRREIYEIIKPILCDVSLRDGLQGIKPEDMQRFTTIEKTKIYHKILFNHKPNKMEIGSIVNPRLLPIFSDTIELLNIINKEKEKEKECDETKLYIITPNDRNLYHAKNNNVVNYSFITSVSNSFQRKNTNKNIIETKGEINKMCSTVKDVLDKKIKLYISCINKCPIEGIIDNNLIIYEILYYNNIECIDEICLSDTCGTLKFEDYKYILDNCLDNRVNNHKLSLHLHCDESNIDDIKKIFNYSLNNMINKFDVSYLNTGGCTMTMNHNDLHNNLSYELYYKLLTEYIEHQDEK